MGKKILIVDDDPDFLQVIRVRLSSAGYDVRIAHDGQDAINKMKLSRPDVVLTDVMMPKLDGIDLFEQMRAAEEMKNIPIIVMTAKGNLEKDFLTVGACDFIAKPFDAKDLIAKIATVLGE